MTNNVLFVVGVSPTSETWVSSSLTGSVMPLFWDEANLNHHPPENWDPSLRFADDVDDGCLIQYYFLNNGQVSNHYNHDQFANFTCVACMIGGYVCCLPKEQLFSKCWAFKKRCYLRVIGDGVVSILPDTAPICHEHEHICLTRVLRLVSLPWNIGGCQRNDL